MAVVISSNDEAPKAHCHLPGIRREPIFDGQYTFNTGKISGFSAFDYTLFALSLFIPTMIGFYQAWRTKEGDFEDFMLARRSMSYFPVGLSLLASFLSAITMSGGPSNVYVNSIQHIFVGFGFFFVCAIAGHVFMPVFYELKVKSCYEYLQMRFDKRVRAVGSCVFALHAIIYMSLVLYTPSAAISGVTGLNMWGTVVAVTVICTLYVTVGGIKAVVWSDSFQMLFMYFTLLVILLKANGVVGAANMLKSLKRTGRLEIFNSESVSQMIGSSIGFLGIYAVNHAQIQRCLTCTTLENAKKAVWMNFPGQFLFISLCILIGMYMSTFYENCDPLQANFVKSPSELLPLFVQDILSDTPGLMGIFLAGISCATLSTVSSCLNSIAMVIIEDGIRLYCRATLKMERERLASQIISIIFGFVCLELTLLVSKMGADVLKGAVAIHGSLHGPILGLFTLGMIFPKVTSKGALVGGISAIAFNFIFLFLVSAPVTKQPIRCVSNCNLNVLKNVTQDTLKRTYTAIALANQNQPMALFSPVLLSFWSCVICVIVGIAVSYVTGFQNPKDVDPRLIVPLFDVLFPFYYLPETTRKALRFGVNHENKYVTATHKPPVLTASIENAKQEASVTSEVSTVASSWKFQSCSVETAL